MRNRPTASGLQLNPGDQVEALGEFGKPTGDFGTVEGSNDDDALVKWDDDGRMRFQQKRGSERFEPTRLVASLGTRPLTAK